MEVLGRSSSGKTATGAFSCLMYATIVAIVFQGRNYWCANFQLQRSKMKVMSSMLKIARKWHMCLINV